MCASEPPLVTICMAHWQVQELVTLCLRSIRKYTRDVSYEILVVDNGSQDASLDYLRSLKWIRLIERGAETPENWVRAHSTALDYGIREGRGMYLLIMHPDVIIKREGWLRRLIDALEADPRHAAAGTGKLEIRSRLGAWCKRTFDERKIGSWVRRTVLRDRSAVIPERPNCPRDFCALYRRELLLRHNLSFFQKRFSVGESIYLDLAEQGYTAAMVEVAEMMSYLDHVAHGTAAIRPAQRRLRRRRRQFEAQRALRRLLAQPHVRALAADTRLDDPE
jgi:GT2 family glycosyltransferase